MTDEKMRRSRKSSRGALTKTLILIVCGALLVFLGVRAFLWARTGEEAELLALVNGNNPLEDIHRPKLEEIEGIKLDQRCIDDLEAMLSHCRADGCSPMLTEGYLSRSEQKDRFDALVDRLVEEGEERSNAELRAGEVSFFPGCDEHELGLAVDIVDTAYTSRDELQGGTATQIWLRDNCWQYGFIQRYPDGKSDQTGRGYEPWHYRYVGPDAAEQMQQLGLTLEEYLLWFYSEEAIIIYSD